MQTEIVEQFFFFAKFASTKVLLHAYRRREGGTDGRTDSNFIRCSARMRTRLKRGFINLKTEGIRQDLVVTK